MILRRSGFKGIEWSRAILDLEVEDIDLESERENKLWNMGSYAIIANTVA